MSGLQHPAALSARLHPSALILSAVVFKPGLMGRLHSFGSQPDHLVAPTCSVIPPDERKYQDQNKRKRDH
jgi:hypothetical protein